MTSRRAAHGWPGGGIMKVEVAMADDERVVFSDEEAAFLRHARFGELPSRVRPDELVELQETEPRQDRPDTHLDDSAWRYP